jgi:hypothetical protein
MNKLPRIKMGIQTFTGTITFDDSRDGRAESKQLSPPEKRALREAREAAARK